MSFVNKRPATERPLRKRNSDQASSAKRSSSSATVTRKRSNAMDLDKKKDMARKRPLMVGNGLFRTAASANFSADSTNENIDSVDETANYDCSKIEETSVTVDSVIEGEDLQNEKVGSLIEHVYENVFPIDFDMVGGKLFIIGKEDMAKRITNKFKIMQKMAHLVGCGLDCHFRIVEDRFLLFMMVRGAPKIVFGATVTVIPDLTNIRQLTANGDFVELGQAKFFESILALFPSSLKGGRDVLRIPLLIGAENEMVYKFYEFLRTIRESVLLHIASMPIVWTSNDHVEDNGEIDFNAALTIIESCGNKHLSRLDREQPGYSNRWRDDWKLVRSQSFSQMMENKFNTY
ncbi:unnamed protein product [Caenorhabditis sp. 36 PRJEB53466]|nr:unnamed protein product [Caenorhabditis sp. 36 PRJEB53466]